MKAVDGTYRGFLITCDEDILELKHMIQNYKPISPNDIAFLQQKLKRKGHTHLVKLFNKIIIGKDVTQKSQASASQPKKKKIVPEKKTCQTKVYKASDFRFLHNEIRVGDYRLNTERAFVIPHSILKNIQGEFTIKILPDKSFYFDNQDLTRLFKLVEEYCFSVLDAKCEEWFVEVIDSIEKNVKRLLWLDFSDFIFNEKNGRYELKNNAIMYSPLSKELLRDDFNYLINRISNIPSKYKSSYIHKYSYAQKIDQFNKEFRTSLTTILRKYVYYTEKDLEVINWAYGKSRKPSIRIYFTLVDDESIYEFIDTPSFDFQKSIALKFKYVPKGIFYELSDDTIKDIESSIEMIKNDRLYNMLNTNIQSIKTKNKIKVLSEEYLLGGYPLFGLDCKTRYVYEITNRLLDISDKHYLISHPKVEDYTHKLQLGYIDRIAYFQDPNYMVSQELPGKYVDCYLLANDEYIALYALDSSKSTYVFKIKSGCIDKAMFLIWSYFSSRIYNKREGKSIQIEHLFSCFGIEWYDNTGSPISKNKDGLYQFILPCRFY